MPRSAIASRNFTSAGVMRAALTRAGGPFRVAAPGGALSALAAAAERTVYTYFSENVMPLALPAATTSLAAMLRSCERTNAALLRLVGCFFDAIAMSSLWVFKYQGHAPSQAISPLPLFCSGFCSKGRFGASAGTLISGEQDR